MPSFAAKGGKYVTQAHHSFDSVDKSFHCGIGTNNRLDPKDSRSGGSIARTGSNSRQYGRQNDHGHRYQGLLAVAQPATTGASEERLLITEFGRPRQSETQSGGTFERNIPLMLVGQHSVRRDFCADGEKRADRGRHGGCFRDLIVVRLYQLFTIGPHHSDAQCIECASSATPGGLHTLLPAGAPQGL